ncbi:activating signal cointegrator 1 complex subunit 2 homolog [Diachasmimorpha longicaudata]|uniref:activating signal cointegrator 1 complex subunit 2 homolog n=1 Tax=Diachasmimorpha longicaudata TaxID=58733 RepID=UPI0030B90675
MKYLILLCILVGSAFGDGDHSELRFRRQAQRQAYHPPAQPSANYRPLNQAPGKIQQLLQFQQYREPIVNIPPQQPPNLGKGPGQPQLTNQAQVSQYKPNVQYGAAPQQPSYQNQAAAIAAQYRPQGQQQYNPQPQHGQPQYQG